IGMVLLDVVRTSGGVRWEVGWGILGFAAGFFTGSTAMVLDSSYPHRRSQSPHFQQSFRKSSPLDDFSWSTLLQRHRFLLTMLALLACLCTIYLYFAVTFGATESCSGMSGTQKALCQAKSTALLKGKLRFF
ncbi:hypothetical protein Taro_012307, partial [Colocasia esculenta]|nr:hypothetical protein [Colocasia esculenta]